MAHSAVPSSNASIPLDVKRYSLFPIINEQGYRFYQQQEINHWASTELDFVADLPDYSRSERIRHVINIILSFFLPGDGAISDNIIHRFLSECTNYEEQAMFISQLHIELVHAETYGIAALTFLKDYHVIEELVEQAQTSGCAAAKIEFMKKWTYIDAPKYQRYLAFACAEGIFFCTLFAIIFWLRSKGWFKNFVLANELIARDESLHRDYGAYLFTKDVNARLIGSPEYGQKAIVIDDAVHKIIEEAIIIEDQFVDYILAEPLEDLTAADLKIYARLITDNLLKQIGYPKKYNVKNPFTWLDDISMEQKGNFYEVRIGAYQKIPLSEAINWRNRAGLVTSTVNPLARPEDVDF